MKTDAFWRLAETIDQEALNAGLDDLAVAPLVAALTRLPPREQRSFEEHLARHLFALDGEVFADHAGPSGDSDDGFLYCRCYVVAKGRAFYERVIKDPTIMPNTLDQWFEPLLYAASQAWAARTGRTVEDWEFEPTVSYETGSNSLKWPPKDPVPVRDPFVEPIFSRAVSRAGHAFQARQFANVVKLLTPHESSLSKKLLSMLQKARAECRAAV